jgi:hypothetical protein
MLSVTAARSSRHGPAEPARDIIVTAGRSGPVIRPVIVGSATATLSARLGALRVTNSAHGRTLPRPPPRESASSVVDAATIIPSIDSGVSATTQPSWPCNYHQQVHVQIGDRPAVSASIATHPMGSAGFTCPRARSPRSPAYELAGRHALAYGCAPPGHWRPAIRPESRMSRDSALVRLPQRARPHPTKTPRPPARHASRRP